MSDLWVNMLADAKQRKLYHSIDIDVGENELMDILKLPPQ